MAYVNSIIGADAYPHLNPPVSEFFYGVETKREGEDSTLASSALGFTVVVAFFMAP